VKSRPQQSRPHADRDGVGWMFHTTAMVADYDTARARLARLAGLRVLECDEDPDVGRRGGMTWIGDNSIEIGEPLGPTTVPGRFVRDFGGGMHSVAVHVDDIDATMARIEARGVRVATRPRPGFFFTDPRDTAGVLIEWADFAVDVDPRSGATLPPFTEEPLLAVTHQAFVGAVVRDPVEAARALADLMGTAVTFEDEAAPSDRPSAGVSMGDCTLALFPLPPEHEVGVWGRAYPRPRTHLMAMAVGDLDEAGAIATRAGFRIVYRRPGMVVLDPRATGDVQVALVDDLLPGDPRSSATTGTAPR
jgi:methylmalonyl-CoA/ethylmalonyl-CoA epimerase